MRFPAFETPPSTGRGCFATSGIPVMRTGENECLDLLLVAREAVLEMLAYLERYAGLTRQQAYVLVGVAGDLRLSEVVNLPNPVVSVLLPTDIFEEAIVPPASLRLDGAGSGGG
jgi:formamidase